MHKFYILISMVFFVSSCSAPQNSPSPQTISSPISGVTFNSQSQTFKTLFGDTPNVEIIAEGLSWAEGPIWIEKEGGFLLFTDVPGNKIYKWSREGGVSILQDPSGVAADPAIFREPGANGLFASGTQGAILVANHGKRAVTKLTLANLESEIIASHFQEKRFNSPNDLVRAADGSIYFTDPPYGLKELDNSPHKELSINGVYRVSPSGKISLLTDQFNRPNGIALSPDENRLYIANSDPENPVIISFPLHEGVLEKDNAQLIHNGVDAIAEGALGLPDGMAVDQDGKIFATAPGGIHVFSPQGKLLGIINTGTANANCTLGEQGRALYIAAHSRIIRIELNQ